jgi:secondary thiamine-phosphate synthase enzyme
MSRSSTATVRRTPVGDVSAATPAGFVIHGESITVASTDRVQLVDVTDRIMALVHGLDIREGMVSIWSMHTTCAVLINESQPALRADMTRFLEELVAKDEAWLHNDPAHSDCSRQNADSHLRAMLLGHSLAVQVSGGEPVLGQWQRILVAELDGPRERQLRVQVWGIAADVR